MKRTRTLLVIAAAALGMIAVFASAASAGTVLCEGESNPCPEAKIKPNGTIYRVGQINTPSLEIVSNGSTFVRCNQNVMNMKTTRRIGNPLPAEFESVIVPSYCTTPTSSGSKCTSTTTNSPPTNLVSTGVGTGVAEIGSATNPLTLSFTCSGSLGETTCVYKATGTVKLIQQEWAVATISAPVSKVSGAFLICGSSNFTLNVNDSVSEGKYISSATETVFCSAEEAEPCPNSSVLPAGTRLATSGFKGLKITTEAEGSKILECADSMTFDSTQESGAPLPTKMGASIFLASCSSWSSLGCSAAAWNTPSSSVEGTGSNKGTVRIGSAGSPLTLTATCTWSPGITTTCTWSAANTVNLGLDGFGYAVVSKAAMNLTSGSSIWCRGTKALLSIERYYGSTTGGPLTVARI